MVIMMTMLRMRITMMMGDEEVKGGFNCTWREDGLVRYPSCNCGSTAVQDIVQKIDEKYDDCGIGCTLECSG